MSETDLQLLARYHCDRAETAFAELVRRHIDLVHTAALRQVRSRPLAEEVAQSVFLDLARSAGRFAPNAILTAWLYQVTRRTAIDVVRRESRRQAREQTAYEMNASLETEDAWRRIEPLLDEAMEELDEQDRTAVLLRYFENKSLREVGLALGASEDAAQKRVSRAIDRLKDFFGRRGAILGAGGIAAALSANAVQSAPVGLYTAVATSTIAAASALTVLTMTTLQKTLMTGAVAVAGCLTGGLILEHRDNQRLAGEIAALRAQSDTRAQAGQAEQPTQTESDRAKLDEEHNELLRLRGQVGLLRNQLAAGGAKTVPPAASNTATPTPEPKPLVSTTFSARVHSGETLVSGGWPGADGKRIFLLSTATAMTNEDSIIFQSQVVEAPEAVWGQLGWKAPATAEADPMQSLLLDENSGVDLIKRLGTNEGVELLTAPRISTANGREASFSVGDSTNAESNLQINVVPTKTADGTGIELLMKLNVPSGPAKPAR